MYGLPKVVHPTKSMYAQDLILVIVPLFQRKKSVEVPSALEEYHVNEANLLQAFVFFELPEQG